MKLPITLILNSDPPKFRWEQTVDTPIGPSTVEHEGVVPIPLEGALTELIELCEIQYKAIAKMGTEMVSLKDRLNTIQTMQPSVQPRLAPIQPISPKKGK